MSQWGWKGHRRPFHPLLVGWQFRQRVAQGRRFFGPDAPGGPGGPVQSGFHASRLPGARGKAILPMVDAEDPSRRIFQTAHGS